LEKISEHGKARGRIEARAEDLLTVLRVRGISVPDDVRELILAQRSPELLKYWLEEASVASSLLEVLGDLHRSGPGAPATLVLTPDELAFKMAMEEIQEREYAEARIEVRADDLLMVLRVRGIAVPDTARELIVAQRDPEQLQRWLESAASASSVRDVLGDLH
jgi:post-segregation antitoxin (ccd killing protein)